MSTMSRSSAASEFRRRMADPMAAFDAGPVGVRNQVARDELRQEPPHANVDAELRQDEERQRQEKPRVYFCVEQKGDFDVSPPRASLPRREQQQRQPRDQHAGDNAAMDQRQGIVGEVRPAKQLVQRAAQHEGEVGGLSCQRLWRARRLVSIICSRRSHRSLSGAVRDGE